MLNVERQEDLEQFLDNSSIGVHIVGSDGTILWANKLELSFLGYGFDDYVGKSIVDFHADQDVIEKILTILTSGSSLHTYPARLKSKDGNVKFVLINSNVYFQNDEFIHTRCFTSEISEVIYNQLRKEVM